VFDEGENGAIGGRLISDSIDVVGSECSDTVKSGIVVGIEHRSFDFVPAEAVPVKSKWLEKRTAVEHEADCPSVGRRNCGHGVQNVAGVEALAIRG